jgi:hypothetical protein
VVGTPLKYERSAARRQLHGTSDEIKETAHVQAVDFGGRVSGTAPRLRLVLSCEPLHRCARSPEELVKGEGARVAAVATPFGRSIALRHPEVHGRIRTRGAVSAFTRSEWPASCHYGRGAPSRALCVAPPSPRPPLAAPGQRIGEARDPNDGVAQQRGDGDVTPVGGAPAFVFRARAPNRITDSQLAFWFAPASSEKGHGGEADDRHALDPRRSDPGEVRGTPIPV